MTRLPWAPGPPEPSLRPGEVHVWRARIDADATRHHGHEAAGLLSTDERARADRFRSEQHRRAFAVCRATLRRLLASYFAREPVALPLPTSEHGKPFLDDGTPLQFNLSHSGGLALYAFAVEREVGVDIELVRDDVPHEALAERFLSPRERIALQSLPDHARRQAFFACWVRKEAFVKARGEGLAFGLSRFSVSVAPDHPARLLEVLDDPATGWSLRGLDPAPGYVAALAVPGPVTALRTWDAL